MSWRTAFLISAATNILIIGALAGFVLGGGLTRVRNMGAMALGEPRAVLLALPADVRSELRRDLVRAWFSTSEERAAWRAANAEALRQIEAQPYDAAAMQAALRRQREANSAIVAKFQDEVAQSLAKLTPEQRAATAAALRNVRATPVGASALGGSDIAPAGAPGQTPRQRLRERIRERRGEN